MQALKEAPALAADEVLIIPGPIAVAGITTVDEPVAAALGYGVDVGRGQTLVAFDFGAGSMEAAAIRTSGEETVETGRAIDDLGRLFIAPYGRQAIHKNRLRRSQGHKFGVHLKRAKALDS